MLKKLLKYDMRSIGRLWWLTAAIVLVMSLVGSVALRFFVENLDTESMGLLLFLALLFIIVCLVSVIGSIAVTMVLLYVRFYRHLFSDEGYLTFTLPAKRGDILLSKVINAVIWTTLHLILYVICLFIFLLIVPPAKEGYLFNFSWLNSVLEFIKLFFADLGAWAVIYTILGVLFLIMYQIFSVCLVYFCISMGATVAKKYKIIAAIGIYYAVNSVLSIVAQLFGSASTLMLSSGINLILTDATTVHWNGVISLSLLIGLVILATFTALIYFWNRSILERKLNLA